MATGMKHWLMATVAGFLVIGAWLLPPESIEPRSVEVKPAEALRYEEVNREFIWTAETLRRVLWSDSLSALSLRSESDGIALLVPEGGEANPNQVDRFRNKIEDEIDGLVTRDPAVLFSYAFQHSEQARTPDMGRAGQHRTETYVGESAGRPYCMQVRVYPSEFYLNTVLSRELVGGVPYAMQRSGVLGACRLYIEHGLPSPTIQGWLERGGSQFASESGTSDFEPEWFQARRTVLGFRSMIGNRAQIEVDQCLAGVSTGCAAIFRNPASYDRALEKELEVIRRSPATSIGTPGSLRNAFFYQGYLLADLEEEFGPEAFASFWTSDEEEVESAFRAAFGMDVGTWFGKWAARGSQPPGPGLPRSASSGSMLAFALLFGLAFLRSRQRRIS